MNEIMERNQPTALMNQEMARQMAAMSEAMRTMAAMLKATNENVEALRRQVATLEKVTSVQVSAINRAMREQAAELCEQYGAAGSEKAAANAIRHDFKAQFGITVPRELPRCDYKAAREYIQWWDDYTTMKAIKRKGVK